MAQLGIPYTLIGPDGTRVVFNDPLDSDFVGYLDSENGVTGLLDTADVREGYFDKPEAHGGVQTRNWFSQRVGTLQGFILPDPNWTVYNQRESKLKAASRGMEGGSPSVLLWTPDGRDGMSMRLYRQGKVSITGRRPKKFLVAMSSPDAFMHSAAIHQRDLIVVEESGDAGFTSPITSPLGVSYKAIPHTLTVNEGDAPTYPEFVLQGPLTNPVLFNDTIEDPNKNKFALSCTLGVGETLYVNTALRTVLLKATSEGKDLFNRYSYYAQNFATNTWWALLPGSNDVRIAPTPLPSGASATILWQDAWE